MLLADKDARVELLARNRYVALQVTTQWSKVDQHPRNRESATSIIQLYYAYYITT